MARPIKQGLDYFPLDIDFFNDDKIQLIEAEFGIKGTYIAIRLLAKIYSEGYYYEWSTDKCLLFTKNIGSDSVSNRLVDEVVKGLIRRGIFNNSVFNQFNILTSQGIQKRFINAISRRVSVSIIKEIWLVSIPKGVNVNIYSINDSINSINDNINTQSKVKESKVNITHIGAENFSKNSDEKIEDAELIETEEIPFQKSCDKKVFPNEDEFINNLYKFRNQYLNTKRFEELCMAYKKKPAELRVLLDEFIKENEQSREHATKTDYTFFYQSLDKHFFYWLKSKINKQAPKQTNFQILADKVLSSTNINGF